ncbi:MAG: hypothetical protein QOI55_539, partial [Actinomycetota bacterium]|nr:hypothetical protein [Actinomycetota bacterium]
MGVRRLSTPWRRRFATRITAGLVAMLVPLAVAIGAGVVSLHGTTQHFKTSIRETILDQRPLNALRTALPNAGLAAWYAATGTSTRASYEQFAARDEASFRHLLSRSWNTADNDGEERRNVELAHRRWRTYVASANQLVRHDVLPTPQVLDRAARELAAAGDALRRAEDVSWDQVRAAQRSGERQEVRAQQLLLWLLVVAVALASAIAFVLTRFFSRQLRSLRAGVQRIGDGDLTQPIDLQSGDELGELGAAIDAMARDLHVARSDLHHLALHDPLTQLPNRTLLLDRIEQAVNRLTRHGGAAALLVIDLDAFKAVNDSLGHPVGDAMLTTVASRLLEQLRDVDTASRIGGDEFAVLVEDITDDAEVLLVAERIRRAIGEPFAIDGSELLPRASVGIAIARQGHETAAELLRNADLAMYAAKQGGKNRCVMFEASMHHDALERASMERALRAAVHRDELVLHYQPTIDLATGRITGVEALIRWEHPELGMLSPLEFIPLAEETGLIVPLGQWVLRTACAQLCEWQRSDPELYGAMKMNVNVSARQLERPGIVADVERVLEQTGIAPGHLVLELTESILASGEELLERLHELRALGVLLAVDDFGTGYSSLAYLRR